MLQQLCALRTAYRLLSFWGLAQVVAQSVDTYISRPDIRHPHLNTVLHEPASVSAGFIFVSFYSESPDSPFGMLLQSSFNGPHIFDDSGTLIWSGASLFPRRKIYDFRLSEYDNNTRLSFYMDRCPPIVQNSPSLDPISSDLSDSAGVVLNNHYEIVQTVQTWPPSPLWPNMHEFNLDDRGRSALFMFGEGGSYQSPETGIAGQVTHEGFIEQRLDTREEVFRWSSRDHVALNETDVAAPMGWGQSEVYWDYIHVNSVDKDRNGDYIVSARHTSTIYKISGDNGTILWRLGGKASSFTFENFHFSSQHDARILSSNETVTVLTLFNNAANDLDETAEVSSALVVALFTEPSLMVARLLREWPRPDGELTRARGNFQLLNNGNAFVCWSNRTYLSEHTAEGRVVLEAHVNVPDFATYRAYKFNYTGRPVEAPVLRSLLYVSRSRVTVIHYVSWNGATEVARWKFFGSNVRESVALTELGSKRKEGFETIYISATAVSFVQATAVDSTGKIIGHSPILPVEIISTDNEVDDVDVIDPSWVILTLFGLTLAVGLLWIGAGILAHSRRQPYHI